MSGSADQASRAIATIRRAGGAMTLVVALLAGMGVGVGYAAFVGTAANAGNSSASKGRRAPLSPLRRSLSDRGSRAGTLHSVVALVLR